MPANKNKRSAPPVDHRLHLHHFIAAWLRAPLKMGAIMPSSRFLARAMAAEVDIEKPGSIIEVGAGTGVVTRALLQAGVVPERLLVIEREERLHTLMSLQFPHLNVVCADAMHMNTVLNDRGITKVNAIVSSLPLASMPKLVRQAIEHQMLTLMSDESILVQFTYSPKSPINRSQLRKYHIQGKRMKLVVANVPPAHVWVYRRG